MNKIARIAPVAPGYNAKRYNVENADRPGVYLFLHCVNRAEADHQFDDMTREGYNVRVLAYDAHGRKVYIPSLSVQA